MQVLYTTTPLPGDVIDSCHFRVEHHHTDGLTGSKVLLVYKKLDSHEHELVYGVREVRSCSRRAGVKGREHSTILVHLKPVPARKEPRMQCKDIDTQSFLNTIYKYGRVPAVSEILFDNQDLTQTPPQRLIHSKFKNLRSKGYIDGNDNYVSLTPKGRRTLSLMLNQE